MNYKALTICMVDNGLFVSWAELLAKDFGKVLYYTPWVSAYPKSNARLLGYGIDGVIRIDEIWSVLDEVDIFCFPDVYFGTLQLHLEKLGKPVWGGRMGDMLELDRIGSKELCKKLGIPIGGYEVVVGLDALREYLKQNKNQYVKVSTTRGDCETFKSKNYKLIEPRLDELEHTLGAAKKIIKFVVEEMIEPAVETGTDGYTIDGKYPKGSIYGIEIKDKGYVLKTCDYKDLPEPLRQINDKLAPVFEAMRYRGFWSTEVRITPDCTPYLIDPTARAGSPPSEIYQELVSNWADIIWGGAHGELVEPKFVAKCGAELLIHSTFADKNWLAVEFPKELEDCVKLRNACKIDGKWYVAPQWTGYPEIGAVVALGDTQEEAIKACLKLASKVEGHYIEVFAHAFDAAQDEIKQLESYGIKF